MIFALAIKEQNEPMRKFTQREVSETFSHSPQKKPTLVFKKNTLCMKKTTKYLRILSFLFFLFFFKEGAFI